VSASTLSSLLDTTSSDSDESSTVSTTA
jgi:hypothetical protein